MASVSFWGGIAVAGVFVLAASYKTLDAASLARTLHALKIPSSAAEVLSVVTPVLELGLAALAVAAIPILSPAALLIAAAILLYAGVSGIRSAEPIPCSCFGASNGTMLGRNQLLFSGALAALAIIVAAAPSDVSMARWTISMSLIFLGVMLFRTARMVPVLSHLRASRIGLAPKYPA